MTSSHLEVLQKKLMKTASKLFKDPNMYFFVSESKKWVMVDHDYDHDDHDDNDDDNNGCTSSK